MMKNWWKYIPLGIFTVVFTVMVCCSFIAGRRLRESRACERIEVIIKDSLENHFVSASDVKNFIDKSYGKYIGLPVDSIDLVRIEEIVCGRSAVRSSEAYMTKDGTLHVDVTQRKPVVRFQKKDGGFYADADGYIFPLQSTYASHVQIIDGAIPLAANSGYKGQIASPDEKEWFGSVMKLVNYMEGQAQWRDKIVQIHVLANGDLMLIPREGDEKFLFGQPCGIEDKFMKIKRYYTAVIPEKGSGKYKVVDLRFKEQIVCR